MDRKGKMKPPSLTTKSLQSRKEPGVRSNQGSSASDSSPSSGLPHHRNSGSRSRTHTNTQKGKDAAAKQDLYVSTPLLSEAQVHGQHFVMYEPSGARSDASSVSPHSPEGGEQSTTASLEKRRAQNRSAQRAFRVRKLQRVKTLEETLEGLISKHNGLQDSYEKQEDELSGLRSQIDSLESELAQLRTAYGRDEGVGATLAPGELEGWDFDAFLCAEGTQGLNIGIPEGSGRRHDGPSDWERFNLSMED